MTAALLYELPIVGMSECSRAEANDLLREWNHPLGPCDRPFHQEQHILLVAGEPVALTVSASTVSSNVGAVYDRVVPNPHGHKRTEVVELARIDYDHGRRSFDSHATYIVTAFVAGS